MKLFNNFTFSFASSLVFATIFVVIFYFVNKFFNFEKSIYKHSILFVKGLFIFENFFLNCIFFSKIED